MREVIAWPCGAIFGTYRVAPAQVTFEYLLVRSYLNSSKGAGIHTGKTLYAFVIVDNHHSCFFVKVHGIGNRTSFFTGCVLAVEANYGEGKWVFFRMTHLYSRQGWINRPRMFERAHYLAYMASSAKFLKRFKNLPLFHTLLSKTKLLGLL